MRTPYASSTVAALVRRLGITAALSASLLLGACAQVGDFGLGGGVADKDPHQTELERTQRPASELEKATAYWSKEHAKSPRDVRAALNYSRNLKALGRKPEALAVLQNSYMFAADNREFLSEYGRLALDAGQIGTAAKILEMADDPAKPDWRIISARGTALAKQGDFKSAITFFERARDLAPAQSSVLNNLAMAYTMDGQADKAEQLLRQAAASGQEDPRVRENLILVLGLQGKHGEAKALRGPAGAGEDPVATPAVAPGLPPPPAEVVAQPGRPAASAPVVARTAPATQTKPSDPDDVIRAAIEADLARNKKPAAPIATGANPARKPAAQPKAAPGPDQGPRLRASAE